MYNSMVTNICQHVVVHQGVDTCPLLRFTPHPAVADHVPHKSLLLSMFAKATVTHSILGPQTGLGAAGSQARSSSVKV